MTRTRILVYLSALLLAVISLLTLHLYRQGTAEVLTQFQAHQLSFARHLASQIRFFLQARTRGLEAVASFVSLKGDDLPKLEADIAAYSTQIDRVYVKAVSLFDERGKAVYSTDPGYRNHDVGDAGFFRLAKNKEMKDRVSMTSTPLTGRSLTFMLAVPIYRPRKGPEAAEQGALFAGVLAFTVDVGQFLSNQLTADSSQVNMDRVWLLDRDGTLLFQPDHPEMTFRNVFRAEGGACYECHSSFRYIEDMLVKGQGTADYQVAGGPGRTAAFAPVDHGGISWIVVVSAPRDRVTAFVKTSFRDHALLLGTILVTLTVGFLIVVSKERMRVRAEDEALRLHEKIEGEKALKESEERYSMLVENMNDGLGVQDDQGFWTYVNERLAQMLKYERSELVGRAVTDFLGDAEKVVYAEQMEDRKRGKRGFYELAWTGKDGEPVFTLMSAQPIHDNQCRFTGSFAVITGITDRKRMEEALRQSEGQLRRLSAQLVTAQENERKRISRELHDELGQALTVMKLRLGFIRKGLQEDQEQIRAECDKAAGHIDEIIENVRRLSKDLSPIILEDFGLSAAIRWLVNNFAKRHNIKTVLDMTDIDSVIDPTRRTVIYRIVQEALTNISRHAQATSVVVTTTKDDGRIMFSIEDDGVGFDVVKVFATTPEQKGLGLATMRAHAHMLGGTLAMESEPGKGTRIMASIPQTTSERS